MAIHAVELVIKRAYKVYIEDPDDAMSEEEIEAKARQMAIDDESNIILSDDLCIEEQDIVGVMNRYDFDD